MNDPRFYHLTSDPRFKRVPRRERKVKVDSRFQHMFSNKGFRVQYDVDKRGRKVNQTSGDDLRKYYHLEGDSDKGDSPDEQCLDEEVPNNLESDEEAPSNQESDEETPSNQESDEESEWEGLSGCDQVIHDWGDLAEGVEFGEQTSHRLALCNMDWDRVNAQDIYVLVNSFKPSGGCVLSVRVYLSDFGRQRMAEEEIAGPANLVSHGNNLDFVPQHSDTIEGGGYSQEKLRQYQLNRLRYYYAVIECDSVGTAEHIYQECDGLEYEHSGGQLDLRFIPKEMMFDNQGAESEATESTLPLNFTPSQFVSTALQQSKVQLTWDETDPHRLKNTMRKFTKEDAAVMDFSAYLASDSEESEDESKYKALLEDGEGSQGQSERKEEMVVTWEPGLKEGAEQFVTKRTKQGEKLTQWERYLCERRRKKKEKRLKRKNKPSPVDDNGFNDEFFQPEVTMATAKSSKRKRKQRKEESTNESAELELLVMDDDDKKHFHYKDLSDDGFVVDVADPRFEAVYQSHLFAPDPAHPQFKKSKGMDAIMREKMRRREEMATQPTDLSLEPLVNAVKRKTSTFRKQKKK